MTKYKSAWPIISLYERMPKLPAFASENHVLHKAGWLHIHRKFIWSAVEGPDSLSAETLTCKNLELHGPSMFAVKAKIYWVL